MAQPFNVPRGKQGRVFVRNSTDRDRLVATRESFQARKRVIEEKSRAGGGRKSLTNRERADFSFLSGRIDDINQRLRTLDRARSRGVSPTEQRRNDSRSAARTRARDVRKVRSEQQDFINRQGRLQSGQAFTSSSGRTIIVGESRDQINQIRNRSRRSEERVAVSSPTANFQTIDGRFGFSSGVNENFSRDPTNFTPAPGPSFTQASELDLLREGQTITQKNPEIGVRRRRIQRLEDGSIRRVDTRETALASSVRVVGGFLEGNRFTQPFGTTLSERPDDTVAEIGASFYGGRAVGKVAGDVVSAIGRRSAVAGVRAEKAVQFGGLGALGTSVAVNPQQTLENAPQILAGGVGFGRGFRLTNPRPVIRTGATSKTEVSGDLFTSASGRQRVGFVGEGRTPFSVRQFGTETRGNARSLIVARGDTAGSPQSNLRFNVQTFTDIPVPGRGTTNVQRNFVGALDRRGQLQVLRDLQNNRAFVTQVSEPIARVDSRESRQFLTVQSDAFGRQTGFRGGIATSSSVERPNVAFFSRSGDGTFLTPTGGPLVRGRGSVTSIVGRGISQRGNTGIRSRGLANRGLEFGLREGVYEPVRFDVNRLGNLSLGRRGQVSITRSRVPQERFAPVTGRRIPSLEGLPGGRTSTRVPQVFASVSIGQNTTGLSGQSNAASFSPFSGQSTFTRSTTGPRSRFRPLLDTGQSFTQIVGPSPRTRSSFRLGSPGSGGGIGFSGTSEFLPKAGGFDLPLPTFGPGKGVKDRGNKGRGFKFAPDLTSSLFNIRGKRPNNLTGFELRPLGGNK